ncbi:unnamed protein product [Rotaria sordida]|uniref:Uncharacterized protein n=1 Tax=Rotaria sordida TaxID=392033 RepID=A0A815RRR4_9BILA|nr:unnamed protein product [Rotaria sordida]CAF1481533.1 unnamed protein product [Rotaria sordida]CAF4135749.1 unnamed protein product [Rotaria sordida]
MELLQYLAFPTQMSVDIVPIRDMPFAAVTVCNANPYRKDRMDVAVEAYADEMHINLNESTPESLAFPMLVSMFNRNKSDEFEKLGFQLSDMLLTCSYNGINCASKFVHSLSAVYGNCFTFNWNISTNKVYTLADLGSTLILREGLSMTFYIPNHLSFPWMFFEDGLILFLHDNNELPYLAKNSIRLRPGLAHTITYRKSQTFFLPKPYTNCTTVVGDNLRHIYEVIYDPYLAHQVAYSEALCYELCEQAYIFSRCFCILPIPFLMRHVFSLDDNGLHFTNTCMPNTTEEECALTARQKIAENASLMAIWCSRCAPQCKHTQFSIDVSALLAPTAHQKASLKKILLENNLNLSLPNDFATNYDAYMDANYLRVTVTCASPYVTINKQKAKLTFVDTFSAIGGQTGLWIGLSTLSLMEFCELIYRLIMKQITLCRYRRNTHTEVQVISSTASTTENLPNQSQ